MLMRYPEYLNKDFGPIQKKIDSDYSANQALWQIFWTESTINTRLEAGDTSLMASVNSTLPNNNRGSWYFNRVRPLLSMVKGHQMRNRKSSIVVPLMNGDQFTADQLSKILLHIFKTQNIYRTISDAFHQGACVAGMNLLHVYLDFERDPINGEIKVDNLPYSAFMIDPYFKQPDLSDASFIWRRSYLSHSACAALMPEYYDEIMALQGNPTGTGRDGRFQYMAEAYGQTQQNRLAYDEYYYRDFRKQKLLVDKETGESLEVTNEENVDIKNFLKDNPRVSLIERNIPTVRLAIMIQDKVFYDGPQPLNIDCMPFVAVIGYYNPMMPYFYSRIQSLATSLRDPQLLLNRRIILSADLLESQVNSGWIFKENTPVDVKHLFQTGQGRIIPIKQDASLADIVPIQPPQIPASFFQLQEVFSKETTLVTGINEELMGQNYDVKSGIRSALQQSAGLTTLEPLFSQLDDSQIYLSELILEVVKKNYAPSKIRSILEGQEPSPYFYNKSFGKYHCMVELGFNTLSQKQMQMAQLLQLQEIGVPIPPKVLINAATIQNKDEIIASLEQSEQMQMQTQQQQAQMQMALQEAQIKLTNSRALADEGLGIERASRVEENRALAYERKAKADSDEELALLNKVKALKELEGLDIMQLGNLIALAQKLKIEPTVPANVSQGIRGF